MATFEASIPVILSHEGGSSPRHVWKFDPGGATKYGISLPTARRATAQGMMDFDLDGDRDVDEDDIMFLTRAQAIQFYRLWWNVQNYGRITDQAVATKVFDLSINMGPRAVGKKSGLVYGAHALVQQAVNDCGYHLTVDGWLGAQSIKAINECNPRELLFALCQRQKAHYDRWCDAKPERDLFRLGLHRRASWPFTPDGAYLDSLTKKEQT